MPNQTANFTLQVGFVDENNTYNTSTNLSISANYQPQMHGTLDVPDATASGTSFSVPFGTITQDATAGVLQNKTGQPLELKINGAAAASQTVSDGGVFCWMNPAAAGGTPITGLDLKTTALQTGQGKIVFHLWGDPV